MLPVSRQLMRCGTLTVGMGAIFTCALDKNPLAFAAPISSGVDSGTSSEEQLEGFKPYSHDAAPPT
jgi:hypothetical protein